MHVEHEGPLALLHIACGVQAFLPYPQPLWLLPHQPAMGPDAEPITHAPSLAHQPQDDCAGAAPHASHVDLVEQESFTGLQSDCLMMTVPLHPSCGSDCLL
jgi:hypothetical protein